MEQDKPHLHEIIRPVREVVLAMGNWVVSKAIIGDAFDNFMQGGDRPDAHLYDEPTNEPES